MKIIVLSDSHGNMDRMIAAVEEEKPDCIFFLGDHQRDGWNLSDLYPTKRTFVVKGNCDWEPGTDDAVIELEGIRFLLTHGHKYHVKAGYLALQYAGLKAGARMVCFGHTHRAFNEDDPNSVWLFNPGTIGSPRGERRTYGILNVKNGVLTAEIKGADTI